MYTCPQKWPEDGDHVTQFYDALRQLAERAIGRRSMLRPEDTGDIAHQAYVDLSEEFGPFPPLPVLEQARRAIARVADRMQKRLERGAGRNREVEAEANARRRGRQGKPIEDTIGLRRTPPRREAGVPTLCRRLKGVGQRTRFKEEVARFVAEAAAVVVGDPRAFSASEIALFTLAWRRGLDAAQIVGLAGTRTPRAVTERLKRISHKIESSLAGYLAATLPSDLRDRLGELLSREPAEKNSRNPAEPCGAELCERVTSALKTLVHRFPS